MAFLHPEAGKIVLTLCKLAEQDRTSISSILNSLCFAPKVCDVFGNRVLTSSSWVQTRAMVINCILIVACVHLLTNNS